MTESLADGPDWHLRSGSRSGLPTFLRCRHVNWFFNSFPPSRNSIPEDTELMKKSVDVQKRFLIYWMYP